MRKFWPLFFIILFALLGSVLLYFCRALVGISFLLTVAGLACFVLAFFALLCWPWQNPRLHKTARLLRRLFLVLLMLFLISFGIIQGLIWQTAAQAEASQPEAQYLLVLGAGLYGERPSASLLSRMYGALPYLRDNPACIAVLSGGQGRGESVSEALAMQRWFLAHGIEAERLILEDKSTSTAENIAFSKPLLDELGAERAVIVTNDFHLFRAQKLAAFYGLETELLSCAVPNLQLVPLSNYLREYFAVMKELLALYLFPGLLPELAETA